MMLKNGGILPYNWRPPNFLFLDAFLDVQRSGSQEYVRPSAEAPIMSLHMQWKRHELRKLRMVRWPGVCQRGGLDKTWKVYMACDWLVNGC